VRNGECVGGYVERAYSMLNQLCEGGIDFAWTARLKSFNLHSERASFVRIYDDRDDRSVWYQLMKQLQSLCFHGDGEQTKLPWHCRLDG
jgi:hypothetical protein